jgi:hypothetical protein
MRPQPMPHCGYRVGEAGAESGWYRGSRPPVHALIASLRFLRIYRDAWVQRAEPSTDRVSDCKIGSDLSQASFDLVHGGTGIRKDLIEHLQPFGAHFAVAARAKEQDPQNATTLPSRSPGRYDVIA